MTDKHIPYDGETDFDRLVRAMMAQEPTENGLILYQGESDAAKMMFPGLFERTYADDVAPDLKAAMIDIEALADAATAITVDKNGWSLRPDPIVLVSADRMTGRVLCPRCHLRSPIHISQMQRFSDQFVCPCGNLVQIPHAKSEARIV